MMSDRDRSSANELTDPNSSSGDWPLVSPRRDINNGRGRRGEGEGVRVCDRVVGGGGSIAVI